MGIKNKEGINEDLSLKQKLTILFVDYIIIIGIISILDSVSITGLERDYVWSFRLSVYFLYYVFPEYFFKRTLGMKLFGVSLKMEIALKSFEKRFLLYSILVFFDRFLLLVIYIFGTLLLTDRNLLLSEKYSGLRWRK